MSHISMGMTVSMAVRRDRHVSTPRNAFGLSEQRDQNQDRQNSALEKNRNKECAAADAAFAAALFRIAFDQTSAQGTKVGFYNFFRNYYKVI